MARCVAAAIALLAAGLSACTPLPGGRKWVDASLNQVALPAGSAQKVKVGDRIRVEGKNGVNRAYQVTRVGEGFVIGISFGDQKSYRVVFADLAELQVERPGTFWLTPF